MINLRAWCANLAAEFRDWEHHEMAMYPDEHLRDEEIIRWVVRVLANPDLEASGQVLDAIEEQRGLGYRDDLPGPALRGVQTVRTVLDADALAWIDEEKARDR